MPSEDYATASKGALKIKGVQGSRVDKHKKKKKKEKKEAGAEVPTDVSKLAGVEYDGEGVREDQDTKQKVLDEALASEDEREVQDDTPRDAEKTEAERRFEERRRKMLDERLKREGVKSHKERVESLNRYLSNLSEHHDMPRIGPG